MQTKPKSTSKKKPIQPVVKPILTGSWHGADAWKLAGKRALSVLAVSVIYLIGGLLLSFNEMGWACLAAFTIVGLAMYYQYYQGVVQGQGDAAFAEIMYARQQEGRTVTPADHDRCFHPFKGFFAALVGAIPFVLFAIVFAIMTGPTAYSLGLLPAWTEDLLQRSDFGDALAYYGLNNSLNPVDIMRIIDRAMVMPFISIATHVSADAELLVERLSPLLVLIAPLTYGMGYHQGLKMRIKINTGIKMGVDKKKRKERKERKARQRSKSPEQLV